MLDHPVAALDGFPRDHRITVFVNRRPRQHVALGVAVEFEQLGRE